MGRNGRVLLLLAAVAAAAPSGAAVISDEGPRGRRVAVRTGTPCGECRRDGAELVCSDGARLGVASRERGCMTTEGGAQCEITPRAEDRVVVPDANVIDVECGTGAKKGYVYTISDGDGKGSCAQDFNGAAMVDGGSCTKGRVPCAIVDCDHGCEAAALNCECHIKSRPRASAIASD